MIAYQRRIAVALLGLGFFLGLGPSASAKPRLAVERRDLTRELVEARRNMREIEERIRQLEALLAREARLTSDNDQQDVASCTQPFFIDPTGVKHLRPECMAGEGELSCSSSAFVIGEDGLKRLRPACSADAR